MANGFIFTDQPELIKKFAQFEILPAQVAPLVHAQPLTQDATRPKDSTSFSTVEPISENEKERTVVFGDFNFLAQNKDQKIQFSEFTNKYLIQETLPPAMSFSELEKTLMDMQSPKLLKQSDLNENLFQNIIRDTLNVIQHTKLQNLATELNFKYEEIKSSWTLQIEEHERNLKETRLKLFNSNRRNEILKSILFKVAFEPDVLRLESILNELLPKAVDVAWIKIISPGQLHRLETEISSLKVSSHVAACHKYMVVFIRSHDTEFKKTDLSYFQKILDGLEISLRRNEILTAGQELSRNLGSAFNSFPQPLLIIDANYNIRYSSSHFKDAQNLKCYQSLFGRQSPCEGCSLGQKFNIVTQNYDYSVTSQSLRRHFDDENLFLNTYQDQIEQKRFEKRLAEKSEIEDLGLVSSSIAHELNNPIGGIKSLLQLNKMTFPQHAPLIAEIDSMLSTIERIERIVKNLREFAIRQDDGPKTQIQLLDLIQTTLNEQSSLLKENRIQVTFQKSDLQNTTETSITVLAQSDQIKRALESALNFFVIEFNRESAQRVQKIRILDVKLMVHPSNSATASAVSSKTGIYLELVANTAQPTTTESLRAIEFLNVQKTLINQGFSAELFSPHPDWLGLRLDFSSQT